MRKRHKKKAVRKLWRYLMRKLSTPAMTAREMLWLDRAVTGWTHRIKAIGGNYAKRG